MFRNLPGFKSFPSVIGLPFLSSNEDAQLKFRSGENGIKRLYSDEVVPLSDFGYWAQYYTLFNSAQDVYSLISVQDVRQALSSNPINVANLLSKLSHHLFMLLPSPMFPGTSTSSTPPQDTTKECLNCLRVLGRIIVVIYEAEADARDRGEVMDDTFGGKWLWRRMKVTEVRERGYEMGEELDHDDLGAERDAEDPVEEIEYGGQFTLEASDDEDSDQGDMGRVDEGARAFKAVVGNPPKGSKESTDGITDPLSQSTRTETGTSGEDKEEAEDDTIPCLIDRLFSCTIDLLFCAGFTVPENVKGQNPHGDKINYVIWEKGVGSTVSVGSSAELDRNKTELLRFLMILLSTTIYTPPHALPSSPNLPLEHLTHSLERRLVLSLLCSLLNTSLTPSKASSGMTGQLPYNHLISKAAEERRTLVRASMMTLLVALDYRKIPAQVDQMGEGKDENAFRYFLSKLHRKEDFAFILQGILGILEEHSQVINGYLPGSKKPVPYILETFMLFWRMIDLNKRFRAHLFDSGKAVDVTVYILLTCLELKDDPAHHGLLRLLSYVLQTLSADQAFAQCLNQSIRLNVPAKWAVAGTAADFLIVSTYSIATTPGLNPLFPALTISIANVAPHLRNVGVQASTRLMQLFKAFSTPGFLLADEGHPRLVYYLLETINSILYHQLNENPNFVYSVLRSHQDFQTLATFTLMSGLRDIQKKKAVRAAEGKKLDSPKGLQRSNSEMDMIAEKAALLGRGREPEDGADTEIPRLGSDNPTSPMDERNNPSLTMMTPGDGHTADPLASLASATPTSASASANGNVNGNGNGQGHGMSEKARGKMRAVDPAINGSGQGGEEGDGEMVDVPDEELMKVAMAGVGPNSYIPTQEWVSSWQKGLPLDPVLVAISELLPKIQDTTRPSGAPSSKVFKLLKEISLEDVLPPGPPILPRRFQWSTQSTIWLTSLLWGDIYVAGLTSVGVWRDVTVRLFGVKQAPVTGRTAQVGRVLKMIGVV